MNRDDELYLFFKTKQKVHEHFSIQLKNEHQKLIFEAKKNRECAESNHLYKLVDIQAKHMPVDRIFQRNTAWHFR